MIKRTLEEGPSNAKKKGAFGDLLKSFQAPRSKPVPGSKPPPPEPLHAPQPTLGGVEPGQVEGWRHAEVRLRTVWSFWHAGEDRLPSFYGACVASWRLRLGPTWDVRVLNLVEGHPNNVLAFLTTADLPNRFHVIR